MGDNQQLQELHDIYVWEVNAAVGEGRPDLVWQLADAYLDRALELITEDEAATCGRTDCVVCEQPRRAVTTSRRRRWHRRTRSATSG